jgi:hypothetical protein
MMKAQFFIISSVIMVYVIMMTFQYLTGFSDIRVTRMAELQEISYMPGIKEAFLQTFNSSNYSSNGDYNRIASDINSTSNFFKNELLMSGIDFDSRFLLFSNGFEAGDTIGWTGSMVDSGCDMVVSQNGYSGEYGLSAHVNGGAKRAWVYKKVGSLDTMHVRMYVRFNDVPNVDNYHVYSLLFDQSGNGIAWLYVDNWGGSNAFGVWDVVNDVDYRWYTPLKKDYWYEVELKIVRGDSNGEVHLSVDGVEEISQTGIDTNSGYVYDKVYVGNHYSSEESTNYIDCVAVSGDVIGGECYPDQNNYFVFGIKTRELQTSTGFSA